MIMGCLLLASTFAQVNGQAPMKTLDEGGKRPNKIEKANVPKEVKEIFIIEYATISDDNWYGYPNITDNQDWYDYNPYYVISESPENYIVEFSKDETPTKVVYTKQGKKFATHRNLKSELPKAILNALNSGVYKTWTVKKEKEEIFKESDKTKIFYRVVVENGKEKHALFFLSDGKLVKDKIVKS